MDNVLLWRGLDIITCIFETLIYYMFFRDFLGNKNNFNVKIINFIIFLVGFVIVSIYFPIPTVRLIFNIVGLFYLTFLFNGDIKLKLFATILVIAFLIASEIITMFGISLIGNIDEKSAFENGTSRFLGIIISKMVFLIITKVLCFYKQRKTSKFPIIYWIAVLSISVITVISMYVIVMFNIEFENSNLVFLSFIACVGLLFCNILIFYLFEFIIDKTEIKMHNNLLKKQIEYQLEYLDNIIFSNNKIRTLKHDIKNHFICITQLLTLNETTKAKEYINEISDVVQEANNDIQSGNPIIDSILNAKINKAINDNINVTHTIEIPPKLKIEYVDACIIFGNALDNAIEACNRIKLEEKHINIVLTYSNNKLICKINNSTNGIIKKAGKQFITSKSDSIEHGLGLKNIEMSIMKYNGSLNTEYEDYEFKLLFVLYNV